MSLQAAAIAKKAHKEGSTLKESALALGYCTEVGVLGLHQATTPTQHMLLLCPMPEVSYPLRTVLVVLHRNPLQVSASDE